MFQDDRSFRKFFHLHGGIGVPALTGLYDRKTNVLHVFDWRNVPMASRASTNIYTRYRTREPISSLSTRASCAAMATCPSASSRDWEPTARPARQTALPTWDG